MLYELLGAIAAYIAVYSDVIVTYGVLAIMLLAVLLTGSLIFETFRD